jgi:hypothetical protein
MVLPSSGSHVIFVAWLVPGCLSAKSCHDVGRGYMEARYGNVPGCAVTHSQELFDGLHDMRRGGLRWSHRHSGREIAPDGGFELALHVVAACIVFVLGNQREELDGGCA